jgi:hypothetical protein
MVFAGVLTVVALFLAAVHSAIKRAETVERSVERRSDGRRTEAEH